MISEDSQGAEIKAQLRLKREANSHCEPRTATANGEHRTPTKDTSCKQPSDNTRRAECEANEDEIEREAISNVDKIDTLDLRATSDNRTELRLPTMGVSEQGLNCH